VRKGYPRGGTAGIGLCDLLVRQSGDAGVLCVGAAGGVHCSPYRYSGNGRIVVIIVAFEIIQHFVILL